jgi:DnaJ-class molecular chaperone
MAKYSTYYSCRSRKWASYKNHRIWCCRIRRRSKRGFIHNFHHRQSHCFKRDKENLYASVDLDLYKAILGGDITIDTFDGKVKLNVPGDSKWNQSKTGKGFPVYKKGRSIWRFIHHLRNKIPISLSEKRKRTIH